MATPFPVTATFGIPIGYGLNTGSAPVAIPLGAMVFGAASTPATALQIDLSQQVQRGVIDTVTALYVDNSQNPNALTIVINQTGQTFIIGAGVQEYVAVLMPLECQFTVSSAGIGTTNIIVTNATGMGTARIA